MSRMIVWILASFLALGSVLEYAVAQDGQPRPRRRGMRGPAQEAEPAKPKDETKKENKKKEDVYFAVKGADVYTVSDGVLRGATILVKNGKIHEIGATVKIPEKAETLDATGMQVYPGLVALDSRGILGREPVRDSTDPFEFSMLLALASGVTTAVSGNTAAKLTYGSLEDMVIEDSLFVPLGYSTNNPSGKRSLRADLDRVRDYLRDLRAYEIAKKAGDEDAEEPDKKWLTGKFENYRKLLTGEATAKFRAGDAPAMRDVCGLVREYGLSAVIEGGTEAWTMAPELGRAGVGVILAPRAGGREDRRVNRPTGASIETARILYDHGVPFGICVTSPGISLGGIVGKDLLNLPMEAAFAVRGGLPESVAIEAITLEAARILGIDDRIGSIEPGKDADLIVCDGDLLHYETMVQWAIVNGKVVYDKEKEGIFAHIRPRTPEAAEFVPQDYWPRAWIEEFIRGKSAAGKPEQE
jgi:hypothetical protein